MAEALGFPDQYRPLKMRISTTDLTPLASKGRRDGLSESRQFYYILQMLEKPGKEFPSALNFLVTWWEVLAFFASFFLSNSRFFFSISLFLYMVCMQVYIKATGEKSAEMVTDQGAIYITANRGYNWRAAVQETVSATLNR